MLSARQDISLVTAQAKKPVPILVFLSGKISEIWFYAKIISTKCTSKWILFNLGISLQE